MFGDAEAPLPAAATASSFGRLGLGDAADEPRAEDMAAALVGLVAENTGLLCAALARCHGLSTLVFGGSALGGAPALRDLLGLVCLAHGLTPRFPEHGAHLGARGALALALGERSAGGRSTG